MLQSSGTKWETGVLDADPILGADGCFFLNNKQFLFGLAAYYSDCTGSSCTARTDCNFTTRNAAECLLVSQLFLNNKTEGQ